MRLVVGSSHARASVRFELGLTVVGALAQALALPRAPSRVSLRRGGVTYEIDLNAIARGERADTPLEPDDEIVVAGDFPIRPQPSARALSPLGVRRAPSNATCGEMSSETRSSAGKGANHPDVIALEARLAACAEER